MGYSAPIVYKKNYDAAGATQDQMLYLHRDYQGSILAITNQVGVILEKRQFDAWGTIIQVQDGAGNNLTVLTILDRGYTGHEHLQSVGLIHMNGRLYDPKLHRFLQPDNYVQDSSNTQNYNRYGYVLNNPLKYTDPSGESFWKSLASVFVSVAFSAVGIAVGILTDGAVGWVGYVDFNSGDWQVYAAGWGMIAGAPAGGFVNFGQTDGVFSFYGGIKTAPKWLNGDNKPKGDLNGVDQNGQGTNSGANGNGGGQGGNLSPAQQAQIKARNEAQRNFYGADIRIIPNFFGGGSYYAGAINIPKYMWDGYRNKGLDSYEGRFLMHEYGHYLQEEHSPLWYNTYAAPSSFFNAMFNNQTEHANHWAEIQASTYAYYYFGFPKNFKNENIVNPNYLSLEIRKSIFRKYLRN